MTGLTAANIPPELIALPQWVVWRSEARKDDPAAKPTKIPYQCTGYMASSKQPGHWSRFDYALETWQRQRISCDGIGFVFSPDDSYCGIDLDDVWLSDAAETPLWANEIIERFSDSYSEESPRGRGLKIWCRAKASRSGKWPLEYGSIEIYDRARFFTVTGRSSPVRVVSDHQEDVDSLIEYLGRGNPLEARTVNGGMIPYGSQHNTLVSWAGTLHRIGMRTEVIEIALQAANSLQCEKPGPPENIRKIAESTTKWHR